MTRREKKSGAPGQARGGGLRSISAQFGHAIGVVIGIAQKFGQRAVALHVEADVVFVGHADAAVHLHGLVGGERGDFGGARLGEARCSGKAAVVAIGGAFNAANCSGVPTLCHSPR